MKNIVLGVLGLGLVVVASASGVFAKGGVQAEVPVVEESLTNTVVVKGNTAVAENTPGWMFNRDIANATPIAFNTDAPKIGVGSLYVLPIGATPAHKFVGENFINTPIVNVNSVSYDFKIGTGGVDTKEEQFYMNVYANFGVSDDLKFYDCRYSVIPTVGSVAGFTTVTFDPTLAYPVATRTGASASPFACPASPAAMDALSPGSNIRMFALNLGDTTAVDLGLDGYFDNVVVDLDGGVTTYDFEPTLTPVSKEGCKDDGWKSFNTPTFKNQGECVSFVTSNPNSGKQE